MFAIFMLLTIFGNLAQQMMPHFVTQRALYEVRERPSKAYSWKAFMIANIFVEIPWQTLMAVLTFCAWYYPIGLHRNAMPTNAVTERGGLMFLLLWTFYIWISTFSHMLIAGIEIAENGGNIGNLLFSLALIFCGVLAPPGTFPKFWIFLYRISPFTYLVSGMLSTGVANASVTCSDIELLHFEPKANMTCGDFMKDYILNTGMGEVYNPMATSDCQYCPMSSTNQFLAAVSIDYNDRWRNFGLMMVYIIFNIFGALGLYWLIRVPKKSQKKEKSE
jgi:ATP-binding cassette subfamily G (WHITE) protein 2 (PDR)